MMRKVRALAIGAAVAVASGLALWLLLGVAAPIALVLGSAVGAGMGLLTLPGGARTISAPALQPTTTAGLLEASTASAADMAKQLSRLTSRALWTRSSLDERIGDLLAGIRTLAAMPALQQRERADGDVQTLYLLATDYVPTLVNLMIENDRMHAGFRGASSRDEVERNVAALGEQSAILGEVLERLERDAAQGVSRDAEQHAAFLASRFEQLRTQPLLDLTQSTPTGPPPSGAAPDHHSENGAPA